jgi:formylglycine-generating enzyme required for sulfatase activity
MMPIPAGTVQRTVRGAAAGTVQSVPIPALWVARTEVTWDLYDVYVFGLDKPSAAASSGADAVARPSKPYVLPGDSYGHQGYPALGMSLLAAKEFAKWVSAKTGRAYRLPTEAEWVHICTSGITEPSNAPLSTVAWLAANAADQTHPVGTLPPNAHGVHDLLGNAAEWALSEADSGVMGGGFSNDSSGVSCTARRTQTPSWNVSDPQLPKSRWWLTDAFFVGVRLVRSE